MGSGEESRLGDTVCLMILDRFTGWMGAYLAKTKSAEEVVTAFSSFIGHSNPRVKRVYIDGSKEFERQHTTIEGGRKVCCAFVQSGFAPEWWADVARAFVEVWAFFRCTDG